MRDGSCPTNQGVTDLDYSKYALVWANGVRLPNPYDALVRVDLQEYRVANAI